MSGASALPPLIDAESLKTALAAEDVVVLDATWTYPGGPRPRAEGRIPGAVAFDIDAVAEKKTSLPHMLPKPSVFKRHVDAMGVTNQARVVVYDRMGVFASPRVWWMFKTMGHGRAQVLDGGLPAWIAAGGAVEAEPPHDAGLVPGDFRPQFDFARLTSKAQVGAWLEDEFRAVVDARSPARFRGDEPEPRKGLKAGRMPGAKNLPWSELVTPEGTLKPPAELAAAFEAAGVAEDAKLATTCGSGVTAAVLALAWEVLGRPKAAVYDGSWAEWGRARGGGEVATG